MPEGCELVAYADDLALLVSDKNKEEMVIKAETAIDNVNCWMEENKLCVAPEKNGDRCLP